MDQLLNNLIEDHHPNTFQYYNNILTNNNNNNSNSNDQNFLNSSNNNKDDDNYNIDSSDNNNNCDNSNDGGIEDFNKSSINSQDNDNNFSFFFSPLEMAKSKISMIELEPSGGEYEITDSSDIMVQSMGELIEDEEGELFENNEQKNKESISTENENPNCEEYFSDFFKFIENETNSPKQPNPSNNSFCEQIKPLFYNIINNEESNNNNEIESNGNNNNKINRNSFDETSECWEYLVNCVDDASSNIVYSKQQNQDNFIDDQGLLQLEEKEDVRIIKNKTTFDPSSLQYRNIVDLLDTKEISLSTPISPLILNNENNNTNNNDNRNNTMNDNKTSPTIILSPLNLNISHSSPNNRISPISSPGEKALSSSMSEISKPLLKFQYSFNLSNKDNSNYCGKTNNSYEIQDFKSSFNYDSISPLPAPKHLSSSCPSIPSTSPNFIKPQNQQNIAHIQQQQQTNNSAYILGEPVVPGPTSNVQLLKDGIVNVDGKYFFNEHLYQLQLRKKSTQSPQQNINTNKSNNNQSSSFSNLSLSNNDNSFFSPLGVNPITDFFWNSSQQQSSTSNSLLQDRQKLIQQQVNHNVNNLNSINNVNSNIKSINNNFVTNNHFNSNNNILSNNVNNVNNIININKNINIPPPNINIIKNGNNKQQSPPLPQQANNNTITNNKLPIRQLNNTNNSSLNINIQKQNNLIIPNMYYNINNSNINNNNNSNYNMHSINNSNNNNNNFNHNNSLNQQIIGLNLPNYYNQKLNQNQIKKEISIKSPNFIPHTVLQRPQNYSVYN